MSSVCVESMVHNFVYVVFETHVLEKTNSDRRNSWVDLIKFLHHLMGGRL